MPRKAKTLTRNEELEKHAFRSLLMEAVTEILQVKDDNGGKVPYGTYEIVLGRIGHPKVNREAVKYQIRKLESARAKSNVITTTDVDPLNTLPVQPSTPGVADDISQLTSPSMLSNSSDSSTIRRRKAGRPKKVLYGSDKRNESLKLAAAITQACKSPVHFASYV